MVGPLNRQSTLFYVAFGEQAALIKDEKLDAIDVLLHDEDTTRMPSRSITAKLVRSVKEKSLSFITGRGAGCGRTCSRGKRAGLVLRFTSVAAGAREPPAKALVPLAMYQMQGRDVVRFEENEQQLLKAAPSFIRRPQQLGHYVERRVMWSGTCVPRSDARQGLI